MSVVDVQKPCKCGKAVRPGQRNCSACNRTAVGLSKRRRQLQWDTMVAALNSKMLHADAQTKFRFYQRIPSYFVHVLPEIGSSYVGLPIGFLPADEVVVVHSPDCRKINIVPLNQLSPYGTNRPKISRNHRPPSPQFGQ